MFFFTKVQKNMDEKKKIKYIVLGILIFVIVLTVLLLILMATGVIGSHNTTVLVVTPTPYS